jgi:hypothetical protein
LFSFSLAFILFLYHIALHFISSCILEHFELHDYSC